MTIHKLKTKIIALVFLGLCILTYVTIILININRNPMDSIIAYYNDPFRPAWIWYKWDGYDRGAASEIVRTSSQNNLIVYSLVSTGKPENKNTLDRNAKAYVSVDVVKFRRDWLFSLVPVELIMNTVKNSSFNEVVNLAKEKDISLINAGLKEDDPRYDKNITTFKNPTKEEWMQKLEDQKAKLFHSIPNPSGTDALEYYSSKAYDGEPSFFSLKSENKADIYKKYFITFNTPYIEDFSVWINDDEFICDIQKPSDEYSDPIIQTKEYKEFYENHKEGVYVFNKNTKSFRLFADIKYNDKKGERYESYFLTHAKNIVVQSNTTIYEYDREGNFMSSQKIPEQPIITSGPKDE